MAELETPVAVSAPGKVLFAGGFLVLDQAHSGLVFGLDARIHIIVCRAQTPENLPHDTADHRITVRSPQFQAAQWLYSWRSEEKGLPLNLHQLQEAGYTDSPNPFVETTLRYTYTYLSQIAALSTSSRAIDITILADDAYYSSFHATPLTTHPKPGLKSFLSFNTTLSSVHKTGLGSSAALVTALTTAILLYHPPAYITSLTGPFKQTVHNLSQAIHSAAQGKIGSGFDIAAAIYGSSLYKRFSPNILSPLSPDNITSSPSFPRLLRDIIQQGWDTTISPHSICLPRSLQLVMIDINHGTSTPSAVRQLLSWRAQHPEQASLIWETLQKGTDDLAAQLSQLCTLEQQGSNLPTQELSDTIATIRSLVREMSLRSNVPIEPPGITELLDYVTALPGVVGGVAPGAGGYDAVALLVRNDAQVLADLTTCLHGWKGRDHGDGVVLREVSVLHVKQSFQGVRIEKVEEYKHMSV